MPSNFTDITSLIQSQQPQPEQHISYGMPEKAPPRVIPEASKNHVEIHEVVEHEPAPEVKPYVENRPEKIEVPEDLSDVGVQSTETTNFPTYNSVKLPISDDRVMQGLRSPISQSIRWLAEFCVFLLRRAHIKLKIAHGKAFRMFDGK